MVHECTKRAIAAEASLSLSADVSPLVSTALTPLPYPVGYACYGDKYTPLGISV